MHRQLCRQVWVLCLIAAGGASAAPGVDRQAQLRDLLHQDCGSCHGMTLRGGLGGGNPELIEQEYLAMLDLVEQLELQLVADEIGAEESAVRTQTPAEIAAEYEEAVAEYFRQLSRSEQP